MSSPLVSVIVSTKNEEKNIENCLQSIIEQSYPQQCVEIIVVDNSSSDDTKKLAKNYTDLVFDKGPERSAQRNFGFKISKGKYLLYLDADMVLSRTVFEESVSVLEAQDDVIALYIPEIIMGDSFWCRVRRFERTFYNGTVIDAVRFIKSNEILSIGGFNESMIAGEDWDLTKRLKNLGKFKIISSCLYHNEKDFKLKTYLDKKSFYIKDLSNYIGAWGGGDPDLKKQLGFWYRYFEVFFERKKWKKLLIHPFLTFGMYILRVLVGISYLFSKGKR